MDKYILSSKTLEEIEKFVVDLGEPKFRAKQLYSWIYTKFASDFDQMSDISKSFRENLKENALLTDIKIKERQISSDKTIKYLLEYTDGNVVKVYDDEKYYQTIWHFLLSLSSYLII